MRALRFLLRAIAVRPIYRLWAKLEVRGVENLAGLRPPFVLASNHTSHFDTPSILFAMPTRLRGRLAPMMGMAWFSEAFKPAIPWWMRLRETVLYHLSVLFFATFPIETAGAAREAGEAASLRRVFRYAGELMDEGWCVLIFPEGALEREAEITEFRPGVGQLALKMQAPVVPVKVEGAREVMPPGKRFPRRRGKITVKFGKPMTFKTGDPAEIAKRVEDAVKSL